MGAPLAILAVAAVSALVSPAPDRAPDARAEERQALQAYVDRFDPLAARGGAVVQNGLKPGVNDIADRRFDDQELTAMAEGWVRDLQAVRAEWVAIEPPAFVEDAHLLYLEALDGYVETAQLLLSAVSADGQLRLDLVDAAAAKGERTDDTYERARTIVNDHRERLGLAVDRLPGE